MVRSIRLMRIGLLTRCFENYDTCSKFCVCQILHVRAICLLWLLPRSSLTVFTQNISSRAFHTLKYFFLVLQLSSVKGLVDKTNMGPSFMLLFFWWFSVCHFFILLLLTENISKILPIFQFLVWVSICGEPVPIDC